MAPMTSSSRTLRTGTWLLLTALTLPAAAGCGVNPEPEPEPQPVADDNTCASARYKELLQTPFVAMGDNEFDYFVRLDQQCRDYKRKHLADAFDVCQHQPYADLLKAKAPSDMSDREYGYFRPVDRECTASKQGAPPTQPPTPEEQSSIAPFLAALAVVGATIANLVASLR